MFEEVDQFRLAAAQCCFVLFASGDVAFDADVAERLAESAAHREAREFYISFFARVSTQENLIRELTFVGELVLQGSEGLRAEFVGETCFFQHVVGVTEQSEVSAVLLEVASVGIDDSDGLFRVEEDFAV